MNKILLFCSLLFCASVLKAQTTYYWVGNPGDSINVVSNWNTDLTGAGSARSSNTGTSDVLVFDGTNLGSAGPFFTVISTAGISCAQLKFTNNAVIQMTRSITGTTTVTIAGAAGEDFVIDAGSSLTIPVTTVGSLRFAMAANNTGRVSGALSMITGLQARIDNTTTGTPGSLVFTSGSSFTTNITAASASYGFGNSTQSSEKWVVFEAGSHLYYDGGFSPAGSGTLFSAIDMKPGSTWHHRATNTATTGGNFFNRKNFGNVIVENGATLNAQGPVYSIENLTVNNGCSFSTFSSGQTVVLGNLTINGGLTSGTGSTNALVLGGSSAQTISGAGTVNVSNLIVADNADVALNKTITVENGITVFGKLNFNGFQVNGSGSFMAAANAGSPAITANVVAGRYFVGPVTGLSSSYVGLRVAGTGIAPNTTVVSYSGALDTIYLSQPAVATSSGVSLAFNSGAATLATANPNGFDAVSGSVASTGTKTFGDGINYTINEATTKPFGISTGSTATYITAGNVLFKVPVTTNASAHISGSLQATAGKVTIRPLDTLHLQAGALLNGAYSSSTYFVTDVNAAGEVGVLRRDASSGATLFPIGNATNYLPATVTPVTASDFALNVFQGITTNGLLTGTPFTSAQKQTVVNVVWNVNRIAGTGDANLKLQWTPALEGTTLATFANSEIGIIKNNGTTWSLPFGIGDNAANSADTTFNSFGQFSVGARPPANPFVFNPLPPKTYGDADFSPGVISANTISLINFTSSNTAVATIVNGNIHIVGVGTTTITAQQASDGFYPAANVSQTLTVSKASLTIKADRKTKPQGDPNPTLTATYTGFVLNETPSVLSTPAILTTTATTASLPGSYLISVSGATAANYNITFINDSLIVRPRTAQTITFAAPAAKTYGNADFAIGASSSNGSIPLNYSSSNSAVAVIVGSNIRITGAGTTSITVSQPGSDLFFPAAPVSQTLTVARAPLTIRVADTIKNYGEANPPFRIVYSGFVLGENASVFTAPVSISTSAGTLSAPGYYALTPQGATAANYNITFVAGRLTILPATGTSQSNLQAFVSGSNTLTVRVYSPEPDLGDVFVYDLNGRLMARKNLFLPQGFVTTTFTVSGLPQGTFVVHVAGNKVNLKLPIAVLRR